MTFRIYMGWDPREQEAYRVAEHSFKSRASVPIEVVPLKLSELPMLSRPIERRGAQLWDPISDAPMSTEFAVSRFCVPFLQQRGWALFVDCDVLCLADVAELLQLRDERFAVQVVKHNQHVVEERKMDGQIQTSYKCKNWSSVMLWNCEHKANRRLTKGALNGWAGRDLHAFRWLKGRDIGKLPPAWNHLVNVDPPNKDAKLLHYTLGGPWIAGWKTQSLDEAWVMESVG